MIGCFKKQLANPLQFLTNEATERRTRGGFERQRLDRPAVEIEEGLRWACEGDKEGF